MAAGEERRIAPVSAEGEKKSKARLAAACSVERVERGLDQNIRGALAHRILDERTRRNMIEPVESVTRIRTQCAGMPSQKREQCRAQPQLVDRPEAAEAQHRGNGAKVNGEALAVVHEHIPRDGRFQLCTT